MMTARASVCARAHPGGERSGGEQTQLSQRSYVCVRRTSRCVRKIDARSLWVSTYSSYAPRTSDVTRGRKKREQLSKTFFHSFYRYTRKVGNRCMRESNDAPYQKEDKRCDMCIFYLIEWKVCRRRNGVLAGLVDRLPFLPFPFRTDGPPLTVQPRRNVREQLPPIELHLGVHQIHDVLDHRSTVPMDLEYIRKSRGPQGPHSSL